MHFLDIQSSSGSWGFYPHDNLGPHTASPSPFQASLHTSLFPFSLSCHPFFFSLHKHLTILLKCKSDSVISLLKVIPWLLMTCWISGSHVAKQTYEDLGDAASFVSWTIASFPFLLLPRIQYLADLQFHEYTVFQSHPLPQPVISFVCAPSSWRGSQVLSPAKLHPTVICSILICLSRLSPDSISLLMSSRTPPGSVISSILMPHIIPLLISATALTTI